MIIISTIKAVVEQREREIGLLIQCIHTINFGQEKLLLKFI